MLRAGLASLAAFGCGAAEQDEGAVPFELESAVDSTAALSGGNALREAELAYDFVGSTVRLRWPLEQGGEAHCSGIKLTDTRILTAGHCVSRLSTSKTLDITNRVDGEFVGAGSYTGLEIGRLVLHYSYKPTVSTAEQNGRDLGVIELSESTWTIPTLTEPQVSEYPVEAGEWTRLIAYGCDREAISAGGSKQWGDFLTSPRSATPPDQWGDEFWDSVYQNNIVAYSAETKVCAGDSGGPLFSKLDGKWQLVGIATSGKESAGLSVFARLSELGTWLEDLRSPSPR